ncbi:MAG TPA: STAS domain-containing protein [Solirubrobacteraceae bacterium]|nr:STAS domain-containing protein [Solirubrobacteraceae bacterium]
MSATPPERAQLRVTVVGSGERTLVSVAGELDIATADEFTASLRDALAGGPVTLDLAELSFVDSSGLRALDGLLEEIDREGWTLGIRPDVGRGVRQLLELTGMIGLLPFEGRPEARGGPG